MRITSIVAAAVLSTALASSGIAGAQSSTQKAQAHYFAALDAFDSGDYQGALDGVQKAEAISGQTGEVLLKLETKALYNLGRYQEAKSTLNELYSAGPSDQSKREMASILVEIDEKIESQKQAEIRAAQERREASRLQAEAEAERIQKEAQRERERQIEHIKNLKRQEEVQKKLKAEQSAKNKGYKTGEIIAEYILKAIPETPQSNNNSIASASYFPGNQKLLLGHGERTVKIFNFKNKKNVKNKISHESIVDVRYIKDGEIIISTGRCNVKIWTVKRSKLLHTLEVCKESVEAASNLTDSIRDIAISNDEQSLLTFSTKGKLQLWNVNTGKNFKTLPFSIDSTIRSGSFSKNGNLIAIGSDDGKSRIYNLENNKLIQSLSTLYDYKPKRFIHSVTFTNDDKFILTGEPDAARVYDINSGEMVVEFLNGEPVIPLTAISPDGNIIASVDNENNVKLWDINIGVSHALLVGHDKYITSLLFSPDGKAIVAGSNNGQILIWNILE